MGTNSITSERQSSPKKPASLERAVCWLWPDGESGPRPEPRPEGLFPARTFFRGCASPDSGWGWSGRSIGIRMLGSLFGGKRGSFPQHRPADRNPCGRASPRPTAMAMDARNGMRYNAKRVRNATSSSSASVTWIVRGQKRNVLRFVHPARSVRGIAALFLSTTITLRCLLNHRLYLSCMDYYESIELNGLSKNRHYLIQLACGSLLVTEAIEEQSR